MTNHPPQARVSRISFITDMTRPGALEIPLGFMLEATWHEQARWLGLIGRTGLTGYETSAVNLFAWAEMACPFDMLSQMFDQGWAAEWGGAGLTAASTWSRSPLIVRITDHSEMLNDLAIDTNATWAITSGILASRLSLLGHKLTPSKPPKRKPIQPAPRLRKHSLPAYILPRESRTREANAAVA
jgi:hypothetical protein